MLQKNKLDQLSVILPSALDAIGNGMIELDSPRSTPSPLPSGSVASPTADIQHRSINNQVLQQKRQQKKITGRDKLQNILSNESEDNDVNLQTRS